MTAKPLSLQLLGTVIALLLPCLALHGTVHPWNKLRQATDSPGPAPVEPILLAGQWYQPHWLGVGAAQAQETLVANEPGHPHLGQHQCFCSMSGLMQRFQPSPISHSNPRDRFLCLSPLSPAVYYCITCCVLLPAPLPGQQMNSALRAVSLARARPCTGKDILSSGQELLWHLLQLCPAVFHPRQKQPEDILHLLAGQG